MAAQVISLMQRLRPSLPRDWSPQEVAEFYRVESALLQAGLELETERGVTDEGEPWFVFCRIDTGEVFIHFARVDGEYIVDGAAMGATARGRDFTSLVRDLIGRHPLAAARRPGSNVFLHPAALLIALVGAAFFQSGHAKAAEASDGKAGAPLKAEGRKGLLIDAGSAPPAGLGEARGVMLDPAETAAVLTGVAIGLRHVAAAAAPAPSSAMLGDALAGPVFPMPARSAPQGSAAVSRTASLAQLSAAETRAALLVVAVVADLPRAAAEAQAVATQALSPVAVAGVALSASDAAAPPAPAAVAIPAPRPALWVHLVEGPLPQIAAVRLVMADPELAKVMTARAVQVESLPSVLADLIHKGDIVDLAHAATRSGGAVDTDAGVRAADLANPAAAKGADPHDSVPAPTHSDTPTAPTAPEVPGSEVPGSVEPALPAAHVDPPQAPPPPSTPPTPLTANEAITWFLAHVAGAAVMVSGSEVVFYDPGFSDALQSGRLVETVTYKLDDGSSISLVGLSSDLHGLHGAG